MSLVKLRIRGAFGLCSRVFMLLICMSRVLFPFTTCAQEYDADCELLGERLVKEVSRLSEADGKWAKKDFSPLLCSPELRSSQRDSIALFCTAFKANRISMSKGFLNYLYALEELIQRDDPRLWHDWHGVVDAFLKNKKWNKRKWLKHQFYHPLLLKK